MLRRCRYSDMIPRFGRPVPELSMIDNLVMGRIYQQHSYRITLWNNALLSSAFLETYALVVNRKGSPLRNCSGFIDGKVRRICRPVDNQRVVYNGHKGVEALKFQSVTIPNGIIANIYGTVGNCSFEISICAFFCGQQDNV